MTIQEAIKARHSVRKYADMPIEAGKVATLRAAIEQANDESGLNIQLVLDEPKSFSSGVWKYGQFYESTCLPPEWFLAGMESALLAPTAVNQQKFKFILRDGNKVEAKPLFSMAGYTIIDLGIVKYHFEVGAGKENFEWL